MKIRVILLFVFFIMLFSAVLGRVFYLQALPQSNLAKLEKSQYQARISLLPQRGKILDRAGEELATSTSTSSLYADPGVLQADHGKKALKKIAKKLSGLVNLPTQVIYEKLMTSGKRFIWLKRQLEPEVVAQVKALGETGLAFIDEGKRIYPNLNMAPQVLGIVGIDGSGLEGLEKKYDAELRGEKVSILSKKDAHGRPLIVSGQIFETSNDGATVETTLDKDLQYQLEKELDAVSEKEQAESAMGIIMDPNTGEILAMANAPRFDPTERLTHPENMRNRVVTDVFEPGSTFKVITAAAALRTGRIHPNTKYFCEHGKMQIGKHWIHEAETNHKFEWLSLAEIIEVSSNIGSTKVAFDVGESSFKSMIGDFGFGKPTGIDFQGEASGIITRDKWSEHLLSNVSFGHGIGVTALQMATAYSTIANGGKLLKPYLVKRVVDSQGHIIQETAQQVGKPVLTPREASTLTLMLSGVTQEGGTGTLARVDGYPVAGKTGTAQKVNPNGGGYIKGGYISSFAGFVPANQPQFVIYIVVDSPKKNFYGAQVAAPLFHKIASFALRKRGFLPIILSNNSELDSKKVSAAALAKAEAKSFSSSENIPDFKGLTVREVSRRIEKDTRLSKTHWEVFGSGVAFNQSPLPGSPIKDNEHIRIYLQPVH